MVYIHREIINHQQAFSLSLRWTNLGTQLITHLPSQLIERADPTNYHRITPYRHSEIEARKLLEKLSQHIVQERLSKHFFYPGYLLINDTMPHYLFRVLIGGCPDKIKGEAYCSESHSVVFYTMVIQWHVTRPGSTIRRPFKSLPSRSQLEPLRNTWKEEPCFCMWSDGIKTIEPFG